MNKLKPLNLCYDQCCTRIRSNLGRGSRSEVVYGVYGDRGRCRVHRGEVSGGVDVAFARHI